MTGVGAFGDRLDAVVAERGGLCVGIDPHATLLAGWGLPDSGAGVREFGLRVVDAAAGLVGVVKPQVAFFERHGAAGYAALEDVLRAARTAGLVVIADAKRGDVGSTADAYGEAWLEPGSALEADAMTAVAYQGVGSLAAMLDRAIANGKGVIVVTAASNPEAAPTQGALRADGRTVARAILDELGAYRGTAGVVLGATVSLDAYGIAPADLDGLVVLAPGFGAQGARIVDLPRLFGTAAPRVLVSVSRSILGTGPDGLRSAIAAAREEVAACLN